MTPGEGKLSYGADVERVDAREGDEQVEMLQRYLQLCLCACVGGWLWLCAGSREKLGVPFCD